MPPNSKCHPRITEQITINYPAVGLSAILEHALAICGKSVIDKTILEPVFLAGLQQIFGQLSLFEGNKSPLMHCLDNLSNWKQETNEFSEKQGGCPKKNYRPNNNKFYYWVANKQLNARSDKNTLISRHRG